MLTTSIPYAVEIKMGTTNGMAKSGTGSCKTNNKDQMKHEDEPTLWDEIFD